MITIDQLTTGFSSMPVIDGLSMQLEAGMVHGLIGLNGSGKTTLLRSIYGLYPVWSGKVLRDGKILHRKDVSYLETEPYFYHGITGLEYLSLFLSSSGTEFDVLAWAALFHVPLDQFIDRYSTGMKKKLALLGVIKTGRKVMLLDEPFNGLDLESARVLQAILRRLSENGATVLLTSHILGTLSGLCGRVHHLKDGRIRKSYDSTDSEYMEHELFAELDSRIGKTIEKLI